MSYNEKIGNKTEQKINVSFEKVEKIVLNFLEEHKIDTLIETFIQDEYQKLNISYEEIKENSKLRTQKNYKKQFGIEFFNIIHEKVDYVLREKSQLYLKQCEEQYTIDSSKYEELKLIIDNIFTQVGMTMFEENLNKIKLISFHYLLKILENYADEYTSILNLKNVRGFRISIEIFRYELIDIVAKDHDLVMFVSTLKSITEQWLIKYNRRTTIGQFYFDILMITPDLLVEKIIRHLVFTSLKNKNPISLRTIFSTYITLIHQNISSHYSTKLTKVKVGHFNQLNSLFEETSSKHLSDFHNNTQMVTISRIKNHLVNNKRFYKSNYYIINDNDITKYLDLNYQDFLTGYRADINLIDYYYLYSKILKHTKNSFSSEITNNLKVKSKFLNSTTESNMKNYIQELTLNKFYSRFMDVLKDEEAVKLLCENITNNILNNIFPKGFLDKNLKLTIQTYDGYINEIIRLLASFEKIFKGETTNNINISNINSMTN